MTRRMPVVLAALTVAAALGPASLGAPAARTIVPITIAGTTHRTTVVSPRLLEDTGTVKGSPIGSGSIVVHYALTPREAVAKVKWTITNAAGTVTGRAITRFTTTNLTITFTGRGRITGGTGRYAGIRSQPLAFNAKHSKTGKKEAIAFRGTGTLPAPGYGASGPTRG